jgi:hypothetical protein
MSYFDALARMSTVSAVPSPEMEVKPLERIEPEQPDSPVIGKAWSSEGSARPSSAEPVTPTPVHRPPSISVQETARGSGEETKNRVDSPESPAAAPRRSPPVEATPSAPETAEDGAVGHDPSVVLETRTLRVPPPPPPSPTGSDLPAAATVDRGDLAPVDAEDVTPHPPGIVDHPAARLETALRVVRRWVEEPAPKTPGLAPTADPERRPALISRFERSAGQTPGTAGDQLAEPVELSIGTIHVTVSEPAAPRRESQPAAPPTPRQSVAGPTGSDGGTNRPIDLSRHYVKVR